MEEIFKKEVEFSQPEQPSSLSLTAGPSTANDKNTIVFKEEPKKEIQSSETTVVGIANKKSSEKPELKKQEAIVIAEEELEDYYDTKTLKPQKQQEWECSRCTLLNPITSRMCAVCATVRCEEGARKIASSRKLKKNKAPQPKSSADADAGSSKTDLHYLQLLNLDNADLVENTEAFECVVCFLEIPPGGGVTLRECLHQFCKLCLRHTVEYAEEAQVMCPYRDEQYSCDIALQDREVKALVSPAVYDQYLAKSVAQAENKIDKSFHCKTPDCKGWCIFEDNVNEFRCPVCRRVNCLTCQVNTK